METQKIKQRWKSEHRDAQAAAAWWDSKASDFAEKALPTKEDSLAIRLIGEHQMIGEGKTVLDIGCGSGRFSFALEEQGAKVIGSDLSKRMIEECERMKRERQSQAVFLVDDWENTDLKQCGWEKHFDLVLANMTPAIDSAETFEKMCEASKNWCLMVKPFKRTNIILDALTKRLKMEADTKKLDECLQYADQLLWKKGIDFDISYEEQTWEKVWSLEDALKEYTLRLSVMRNLSLHEMAQISDFLYSISKNHQIKEVTHTTIAAMYWQV